MLQKSERSKPVGRRARLAAAAVTLVVGVGVGVATLLEPEPAPRGVAGSWDLQFRDEFDGTALDPERWSDHEPWQGWGYSLDEAWYPVPHRPETLVVADGVATLKARRAGELPEDKRFATAHINSRHAFSLAEGSTTYTEARLWAPSGRGLLPAFWLLGNGSDETGEGWPVNGEIDILEFANNRGEAGRPYFSVWYPADVYTDPPGTFMNGTHDTHPDSMEALPELQDSWHTWGLYRSPERMDVYIDGELMYTFRPGESYGEDGLALPPMLFTEPMHIRVTLAVGGEWAGSGWSPEELEEGDLKVDYVRSWRLDG